MILALPRLLVLPKHQQDWYPIIQWYWIKTVFLFSLTDRVPVKGNCFDSGPSLLAETLSWFLLCEKIGYRTQNITLLWVSNFLVEHGVPPAGGPPNSLRLIVSQTPSNSSYTLWVLTFHASCSKGPFFDFRISHIPF